MTGDRSLPAPRPRWGFADLLWIAIIIVLTAVPYWQVLTFDFVSLDDRLYVTESKLVQQGMNPLAVWDALFGFHADNWHPLVWWSLMLDFQLFGKNPAAFHLVNLFWHLVGTAMLFAALRDLTGDRFRSVIVAAIFGIHPLHVESVAWVSERKDVLSGFFWMLGLLSYCRWCRSGYSRGWWCVVTFSMTLGLMSKQIVVTLPCVFLLLDFWPLGRVTDPHLNRATAWKMLRLCVEKLPWFALSACASILARFAQNSARLAEGDWPLSLRLSNAMLSYVRYLWKSIYPVGLSIQYPYSAPASRSIVVIAAVTLVVMSLACLLFFRRKPALIVGWLWFLGTLVPVIGVIQLGTQSLADRYMYLPLIGLSIAAVWAVPPLNSRVMVRFTGCAVGLYLATLTMCTFQQVTVWRNSQTLYDHALMVDPTNESAHYAIGFRALEAGDIGTGLVHLRLGIEWDRRRTDARDAYAGARDPHEQKVLNRRWSEIYLMIGQTELKADHLPNAIADFRQAVLVDPTNPDARMTLGMVLADSGAVEDALREFEEILKQKPNHINAATARSVLLQRRAAGPD